MNSVRINSICCTLSFIHILNTCIKYLSVPFHLTLIPRNLHEPHVHAHYSHGDPMELEKINVDKYGIYTFIQWENM